MAERRVVTGPVTRPIRWITDSAGDLGRLRADGLPIPARPLHPAGSGDRHAATHARSSRETAAGLARHAARPSRHRRERHSRRPGRPVWLPPSSPAPSTAPGARTGARVRVPSSTTRPSNPCSRSVWAAFAPASPAPTMTIVFGVPVPRRLVIGDGLRHAWHRARSGARAYGRQSPLPERTRDSRQCPHSVARGALDLCRAGGLVSADRQIRAPSGWQDRASRIARRDRPRCCYAQAPHVLSADARLQWRWSGV